MPQLTEKQWATITTQLAQEFQTEVETKQIMYPTFYLTVKQPEDATISCPVGMGITSITRLSDNTVSLVMVLFNLELLTAYYQIQW